jgi:2-polyprenyl-6-methoxyphenol hydroxylase-like FAD-dependent oxidoreductase
MTEVLIAGAGPTGLFLALLLTRLKVRVRIIDKAAQPGTTSRALAIQARTLELYDQVELADEVVSRGLILPATNLWRRGERVGHIDLREIGEGLSPYPYALIFPQDEHEKLLISKLAALGVQVERSTELISIGQKTDGVVVHLREPDGNQSSASVTYVAGCDGARSTLRSLAGADFPGGTYEHVFYVADVEAHGAAMNKELHVLLDDAGFLGVFPLAGYGRARLIGTLRSDALQGEAKWKDVDLRPIERMGLTVGRVNWFSSYKVHHRVAGAFRNGRLFLLGDAAHIHSPVGGQGMNTGLGDAMNLAWKLASVLKGRSMPALLDTYEPERIAFARRLVATTDRVFKAITSESKFAEIIRMQVAPRIITRVFKTDLGRRAFFQALSQININYRHSDLSEGRAGKIHAGDRLPWTGGNFKPLRYLDWQIHTYGSPPDLTFGLPVSVYPLDERARALGYLEHAIYLVRPDGYIGGIFQTSSELESYLSRH